MYFRTLALQVAYTFVWALFPQLERAVRLREHAEDEIRIRQRRTLRRI